MARRSAFSALLAVLLASTACPGRGGPSTGRPAPATVPTVAEDLRQLVIPPAEGTSAALERLEKHADEGEIAAAWGRTHYLIDLFDDARFRRDDDSLRLLAATTGDATLEPNARGADATAKVLAFLSAEVNRVVRIDRLHAGAQAALTLLAFDARPPQRRADVFQRMSEVKALAHDSDLSSNAVLRMYGYCRTAFEDAARARWADRIEMLCHCLYPLYDSDPAPYFADDPAARPPPPRWIDLAEGMGALLDRVSARSDRLAKAAEYQRKNLAAFLDENAGQFPEPPDPDALGAPLVARATPYDWTPMLKLGAGTKLESVEHDAEALAMPVEGDGRSTLALALAGAAPAGALEHAIAVAKQVGAARLELLVSVRQRLDVPPGDYWHGRLAGDTATRLAVIPVAIEPARPAPGQAPTATPEQPIWDPERASLGLHLVIGPTTWKLLAAGGALRTIDTAPGAGDPAAALRESLTRVRGAFSDEVGLVLVPLPEANYGSVVAAANAAARNDQGRALFPMLAFAATAPKPARGKALLTRVERRWQATVAVEPAALETRTAVVRRCYQTLLEKQPRLAGTVRLEVGPKGPKVVSGPANRKLRDCALRGAGSVMTEKGIATAQVSFRPKP